MPLCRIPGCRRAEYQAIAVELEMYGQPTQVLVPLCRQHHLVLSLPEGEDLTTASGGEIMAITRTPEPPRLGANVMYASRTGDYTLAAVVARTCRSSSPEALHRAGQHGRLFMVPLGLYEVDLTVFTPGGSFVEGEPSQWTGTYAEHQVKYDPGHAPGTWCWGEDLSERGVRL